MKALLTLFLPFVFVARRNFTIETLADCVNKNLSVNTHLRFDSTLNKPNKAYVFGHVEVTEKISGPLELNVELHRCELTNQNCEKFINFKVKKIGKKFV